MQVIALNPKTQKYPSMPGGADSLTQCEIASAFRGIDSFRENLVRVYYLREHTGHAVSTLIDRAYLDMRDRGVPANQAFSLSRCLIQDFVQNSLCPQCKGSGSVYQKAVTRFEDCTQCKGSGRAKKTAQRAIQADTGIPQTTFRRKYQKIYDLLIGAYTDMLNAALSRFNFNLRNHNAI